MITIMAAVADNRGMGKDNKLPWHIKGDMAFFKEQTTGHVVVMGRKTYESLGKYKPLPNRTNVVITRNKDYAVECGVIVCHSFEEVCNMFKDFIVIGGAEIYKLAIPLSEKMILTHVSGEYEADTFFPEPDYSSWEMTWEKANEEDSIKYWFSVYKRLTQKR